MRHGIVHLLIFICFAACFLRLSFSSFYYTRDGCGNNRRRKNKQLLTELLNLREEIQAMINIHFTFTGKIARISESTMTASDELKKLISATEKLKKNWKESKQFLPES